VDPYRRKESGEPRANLVRDVSCLRDRPGAAGWQLAQLFRLARSSAGPGSATGHALVVFTQRAGGCSERASEFILTLILSFRLRRSC